MNQIRYPTPLRAPAKIALCAFSSAVTEPYQPRLDLAVKNLEKQGFQVIEIDGLRTPKNATVASSYERSKALMACLLNDDYAAVIPPWGGELAIDLLPLLDFTALAQAKPKWLLGYSDVSTIASAITLKLGWASVHCANLMEQIELEQELLTAETIAHIGTETNTSFLQYSSKQFQSKFVDLAQQPNATLNLTETTHWQALKAEYQQVKFSGRLIGGCLDVLAHTFATQWADLQQFKAQHPLDGVILYLENVELTPFQVYRALVGMKLKGLFDNLTGLLLGRSYTHADAQATFSYYDAIDRALADIHCPVLLDVDIGHRPPNLTLINGALAMIEFEQSASPQAAILQTLE